MNALRSLRLMILAALLGAAAAATARTPTPDDRAGLAWLICNYVDSPACADLRHDDEHVTPREWRALFRPFPGWELQAAGFPENVCSERDSLRRDRACFGAWLRSLMEARRGMPQDRGYTTDRDMALIARASLPRGYAPGDDRCTLHYQLATGFRFSADDWPNCRELRRLLTGRRAPATPEEQNDLFRFICDGPDGSEAEPIPDSDPALTLFEGRLADRKVALSIERTNGCNQGE